MHDGPAHEDSHTHAHEDDRAHGDHIHSDGGHSHDGTHTHDGMHTHAHVHDPKEKRRQINRLSRVIGHLEHVKKMLENDDDCAEVLIQLSAAKSALNGLGKEIIGDHISHCIVHAVESGDDSAMEEFKKAIQRYL